MKEIKGVKILKVYDIDEKYRVYIMENGKYYELYLQNINYGVLMLMYGLEKTAFNKAMFNKTSIEDFVKTANFNFYIEDYKEHIEDMYD